MTIKSASEKLLQSLAELDSAELERLLRYHNEAYFIKNIPEITDEAFDKLVERLRQANPNSPALFEIGAPPSIHAAEVRHEPPMLSLDKCYDDETFAKWREKIKGNVIAMHKIDGVACSIRYDEYGNLAFAATRGDGYSGEDVTKNVLRMSSVPKKIPSHTPVEIRGEVHMKLSRFKTLYAQEFANPRNLAAGALKLKDAQKSQDYGLSFFPYDVVGTPLKTEEEKFSYLAHIGFNPPAIKVLDTVAECIEAYKNFASDIPTIDYEIDGVVFRSNLVSEQKRLGETAHHPRFAIAYKFQGESAVTELITVEWSVARTGVVTPVAIVKPVFVSGATVTRASLHNYGLFKNHDLRKKSLVEIVRRGGVIPHLERVLHREGESYAPPTHCPSCDGVLMVDGDFLRCLNDACPTVVLSKVSHFTHVLEILGFGAKILEKLAQEKLLTKPADLYKLTPGMLINLERMGAKLADKLVAEVAGKKVLPLATFINALGIDEIGPTVAETIAENFITLERVRRLRVEDLMTVHGIGISIAESLVQGLHDLHDDIDELLEYVRVEAYEQRKGVDNAHPFFDKSVVFTGKMAHLDRKSAQKRVKEVGGHTPAQMSSQVSYLVIGDEGSSLLGMGEKSTKQKEAEKLIAAGAPVEIISESMFLKML